MADRMAKTGAVSLLAGRDAPRWSRLPRDRGDEQEEMAPVGDISLPRDVGSAVRWPHHRPSQVEELWKLDRPRATRTSSD